MAVYQDKALERVQKGIRKYRTIAQRARENGAKESDTRMIVSGLVADVLGWDAFENLTGEYRIKGNFADFVIRKDDKHWVIVEVKATTVKLNEKHLYQAVSYAANKGVEWVILTNGVDWRLYRVLFEKPVGQELVFSMSLIDEEMKPKQKAELLYLLTPEAQRKDELQAFYDREKAIAPANIARLLLTESVLTRLRSELRSDSGYRVDLDELMGILAGQVISPEHRGNHLDKQIRRLKRVGKKVACEPVEEPAAAAE